MSCTNSCIYCMCFVGYFVDVKLPKFNCLLPTWTHCRAKKTKRRRFRTKYWLGIHQALEFPLKGTWNKELCAGSPAGSRAPVPCAICTLYPAFFKTWKSNPGGYERHTGVEFAGLLLYTEVSLQLPQYSPLLQNQHFQIRHVQFDLSRTHEGWEGSQQVLGNRDLPYLKDGICILEEKVNKIRNGNYERDKGFTALLRCGIFSQKNRLNREEKSATLS